MAFYNNYGVQFQGEFDSIPLNNGQSDKFFFYIRKKNTPSNIVSVLCGSNPVSHEWLSDEAITTVKGSQLEINLLNIDNALPLSTFYSESDDDWIIEFSSQHDTGTSIEVKTLYIGYLVQEDCIEKFSDIGHEIKLSFTDNLGLLKNIDFKEALKIVPKEYTDFRSTTCSVYKWYDTVKKVHAFFVLTNVTSFNLNIGDTLIIENTLYADGIYTINFIDFIPSPTFYAIIYVKEQIPELDFGSPACNIYFSTPYTENILSINEIIKVCLYNTGLKLFVFESNNMEEVSQAQPVDGTRIFDYVYLNIDTFIDTSNSSNCYDILDKIFYRFGCELYQAEGSWRIIRWHELRNNMFDANILNANKYSDDFIYIDRVPTTEVRNIGDGTDIEYGITTGIERPFKYIRHFYKYSANDNMPFNGSFNDVGELLRTYTDGTDTVKEYYANGWQGIYNPAWIFTERFIRVIYDQYGVETERHLVVGNNVSDYARSVGSQYIDVIKDDKLKISFELKTRDSVPPQGNIVFAIITLVTSSGTLYLDDNGSWSNNLNYVYPYSTNLNTEWISLETKSTYIPQSGRVYVYLPCVPFNGNTQTLYKNVKIEYSSYFAGANSVTGHYHKTQVPFIIKNKEDEEIYVDDTIKNYSKGTLFLYNYEGGVRKRTLIWNDGVPTTPNVKLGELITRQFQLWKDRIRIKLEGKMWSVINQDGQVISPNIVIKVNQIGNKWFKFGKLSLNYKENTCEFTLYEMWQLSEDANLSMNNSYGIIKNKEISYEFNYINK